jgi:hypothetical protein
MRGHYIATLVLGFPQSCRHPSLRHALGFPPAPPWREEGVYGGSALEPEVEARWAWRSWWGLVVTIEFSGATYSEASRESSIATIGGVAEDSMVTSIGADDTIDSVGESICGCDGGYVALRSPRSVPSSSSLTSFPSAPPFSTQQTQQPRQASSVATIGFIILCGDYAH